GTQMSPTNDPMASALGGLLGALLGGTPQVQGQMQETGKSLDDVLGSISASEAPTGKRSAPMQDAGGDVLGSLLGSMMSGGAQSGRTPSQQGAGGDMLGSILGSMLGGGAQSGGMPSQGAGGDVLGSLLGGLLGGGEMPAQSSAPTPSRRSRSTKQMPPSGADPIGSILGGLLGTDVGGGAGAIANNPLTNVFVAPIADALARKTGMAPGIARVVVVFGLTTLMSAMTQQGSRKGFNANDLVERLSTDGTVSQKYLKDSGLVSQLAQESGLDQKTAAQSLQQVFQALGTQMGEGTLDDHQGELQTLLRKWK
ncbi:MAG: hypothetical protein L0Y55_17140, partial [Anaerolineales bacterium]|nr:hypothetical protein [Anaerolineales bacterium]